MANQKERIKAVIAKDIRDILLYEIKNEIGFVTVTSVDVSDDFSYARVYVSFLSDPDLNFKKLEAAKGYVRSSLAKKIDLRRAPDIGFFIDRGYENEAKIDKLLKKEDEELSKIKK
jgi:ribosome-binding factor A